MNINRSCLIVCVSVLCLFFQIQANSQYYISKSVFGNGETKIANNNYQLNHTLGQPLIGGTANADYISNLGFWARPGIIQTDSITWQVNLIVADTGSDSGILTFGQAPTATDGLDTPLGEADLPPTPPTGNLDVRFELPGTTIGSLKDFRNDADQSIIWRFKFQPGSGGYPISLSWNSEELPWSNSFYLKDEITGTFVYVDMKNQNNYTLTQTGINSLLIEMTSVHTCTVKVAADWNIISVPLQAADMSVAALFPGAASSAFQFNNGYVPVTTLSNGVGYWLKFNNARDYLLQGMIVSPKQMPVDAGWNIIGPYESDVPIAQISSEPPGIIQSDFFEFNNGYNSVTTLKIGKGYWVKVRQAGTLRVQQSGALNKSIVAHSDDFSPEKINMLPRILIEDSNDRISVLYLALNNDYDNCYELPPVPPNGISDVRFSTNRLVESLHDTELEVLISSAQFPIKLKAVNLGDMHLAVTDGISGSVLNQILSEESEVVIPVALNKILISSAIQSTLPTQYRLSQNYPNPFNPTSMIKFALPEAGRVRILVYNILGEKVTDLINEMLPAGYHQVEIDARSYSSGIYYYVMKANGFTNAKKMAILK